MDSENTKTETIIKVTDWLRGIWEMRRQTGPVQQWIDSIPSPIKSSFAIKNEHEVESMEKPSASLASTEPKDIPYPIETKQPTMIVSAPINVPSATIVNATGLASSLPHKLVRDPSLQSDSSRCSSVESLLELRKADPEAILLGLGFGGCPKSPQENGTFSRIPKRFLQPSKLKGIAINDFMKQQQETNESIDSVSLGYRGLTGSPFVAPSEIVQKIMQRLREHESHEHDPYAMYNSYEQYSPLQCNGTLSVLSPDSRQFLERPRSKSPDMRNKRMIIGQKSFAFGNDGDLIEIKSTDVKASFEDNQTNSIPNVTKDSDMCNNIVDNHNNVFEQTVPRKTGEILLKRLSFDNSMELCHSGISSSMKTVKVYSDLKSKHVDDECDCNQDVCFNTTSRDTSDIRRASDGFSDAKLDNILSIVHERRHSDGLIQTTEFDNENVLARKRKTFKRQTRISDTDTMSCCNSKMCVDDTAQCKESHCNALKHVHDSTKHKSGRMRSIRNIGEKIKLRNKSKNDCAIKCSQMFSEETSNCIQLVENCLSEEELQRDNSKCCIDKTRSIEQVCGDEEKSTTCCCHSGTKKYWKKMEKIIQENKNLENMVSKNRREMAEIREMLNSVLSVRLEPGF